MMHYRSKLDQFIYGLHCNNPFASKFVVEVCVVAKQREKGDDVDKIIIRSLFCSLMSCVYCCGNACVLCCVMNRDKIFFQRVVV